MSSPVGFGVVRLGEVTAFAGWRQVDGHIDVSYERRSLPVLTHGQLERYNIPACPLELQLPSEQTPTEVLLVGFRSDGRTMTFSLKRDKPM
jgi:hypothetical protein